MSLVRAVCFDLDDTLLDGGGNAEAIRRTCRAIAAAHPDLDAARVLDANMAVWRAYFPEVEAMWTLGQIETSSIGLEAWSRTLKACGCEDEALAVVARDTHYRHQVEAYRLYGDVTQCLERLPSELKIALITNGASDLQRDKIRRLQLESRFDVIFISGEHGMAKPAADVFTAVVRALDVQPEYTWHIGDNLRSDVSGARAGGLTAVWLNRHGLARAAEDPAPDHEIASLAELAGLLQT